VRLAFPGDKRRQRVEITGSGRFLRKAMWATYGAAIERHLGEVLSQSEAAALTLLLGKVTETVGRHRRPAAARPTE
jgi:hypothetical protein